MSSNVYKGTRTGDGCRVTVNGFELDPRLGLAQMSGEFDWGCYSKGSAQLALAVLTHEFGAQVALMNFQEFKREVVSQLAHDSWSMDSGFISWKMAGILGRVELPS